MQNQKIPVLLQQNKTFYKLLSTLNQIQQTPPEHFSGLGILVYDGNFLKYNNFLALRSNVSLPDDLHLDTSNTLEFLRTISKSDNTLHDGYIFANKNGLITHVAQYLEVRLGDKIKPHQEHGTRYLTAQIASQRKEVEFVGNVSSNLHCHVFISGKAYFIDDNRELNSR